MLEEDGYREEKVLVPKTNEVLNVCVKASNIRTASLFHRNTLKMYGGRYTYTLNR